MNIETRTEELEKEISTTFVVRSTTNYDKFKLLLGNRTPNYMHLKRLKDSIEEKPLFSPILVNEKLEIIDGQHRYLANKALGFPIFYIIVEKYGLEEVQILNTNTSNWKKQDYLKAYCDQGSPNYLLFKKFSEEFPEFKFQSIERLITLKTGGHSNTITLVDSNGTKVNGKMKDFEEGKLHIPDYEKSREYAQKIISFKPYYKNFANGRFVSTMITIFKHREYNHDEMLKKLEMQPSRLVDCINVNHYKMLLEDIYNFKRRKDDLINLRF